MTLALKNCKNEDLAITVCKPESRKTTCDGILLCLLDHFYNLILVKVFKNKCSPTRIEKLEIKGAIPKNIGKDQAKIDDIKSAVAKK